MTIRSEKLYHHTAIAVKRLPVATLALLLNVLSRRGLFGFGGSDNDAERWSFWEEKKNACVSCKPTEFECFIRYQDSILLFYHCPKYSARLAAPFRLKILTNGCQFIQSFVLVLPCQSFLSLYCLEK